MRCYRYMGYEYGLKAFETRWFKVARPSEFNDPYDCVGIVTGDLRKEVFEAYVRDNFVRLCEEHEGTKDIPSEVFSSPERMIEWYGPRFAKVAHEQMLYRQVYDDKIRVLCLVRKDGLTPESDALMWSHYADGGNGIRIEVDLGEDMSCPYALRAVNYSETIPRINLSVMDKWPDDPKYSNFFMNCIWTKGKTWAYENEARLICSPEYPLRVVRSIKCDDGKERDFVHMSDGCVKGIAFGPKTRPDVWAEYFMKYQMMYPQNDIVFERALLETDRYAYGYENLNQSMTQFASEYLAMKAQYAKEMAAVKA